MESAINKAIAELDSQLKWQLTPGEEFVLKNFRNSLKSLLPYEAARDRKIAENSFKDALLIIEKNQGIENGEPIIRMSVHKDIETYINQNHPL